MFRLLVFLLVTTSLAVARPNMPYREAGLSRQEAAAHLLSRLSFGATPGQVESVAKTGLEEWFEAQLRAQPGPLKGLENNSVWGLRKRKLERAVRSDDQLFEVMADFWFNHFNVSHREARGASLADYEEKAIRPHVLGKFQTMLEATAHHPAMLVYLNNDRSRGRPMETERRTSNPLGYGGRNSGSNRARGPMGYGPGVSEIELPKSTRQLGINENYARELMELHTLGVDGGYTQQDVVEVARALTGWNVSRRDGKASFVYQARIHDNGEKKILRRTFPAGRGKEEGDEILRILARHPSTAKHIAKKFAVRFVSDRPSKAVVEQLRRTFLRSGGDSKAMLTTLVESPEFWKSRGQKVKTPFEFCVSALRWTGADLQRPQSVISAIQEMGQPLYQYQPPTGFPDRANFWINPGTLARRMNFGLQLTSGGIGGVRVNPPAYRQKPRSGLDALTQQAGGIMDKEQLKRLVPLVDDKELEAKVGRKAKGRKARKLERFDTRRVVGILIGSPQFQRR